MMNELNNSFNGYLEAFKQLQIPDKRQEVIYAINEITASFASLAEDANINVEYIKSKEITELNNGYETEDDYLEALLVYIENAKNVLGQYLLKVDNK